ncbi:MAG: hypothetical protein HOL56_07475 [Flavobacteriales bacterium]|jgi:hypothetical protein|nr:hypothetical protein [Flavobacteriales bacterium]MBT5698827.1 hypothetical protein [Flavobacteriales bacterium]
MKKLMSILGAVLFVFALTLSSCGGEEEKSTCKQDPKCENDAACKKSTEEGCKGYVAPEGGDDKGGDDKGGDDKGGDDKDDE